MSYEYNKVMNEMDIFFRGANWKKVEEEEVGGVEGIVS